MALIPYEPFRRLEDMKRELDRFFTSDFPSIKVGLDQSFGSIRIDVYETKQEVVATCDIPGVEKKEDINIDIDNNILTVSGNINRVNEIKEEQMHRRERYIGRFQRSVNLPSAVSPEDVKASYRNGVLEIRMPKIKAENKMRINVEFQ